MAEITFREATKEDADFISKNLRESDKEEVIALGMNPDKVGEYSRQWSDTAYTGLINGVPAMIFGAGGGVLSDKASVWALGTDLCSRNPKSMIKFGRRIISEFLEIYPSLENHCDARYEKALRWLKKIGFEVSAPFPFGKNGELFCKIKLQLNIQKELFALLIFVLLQLLGLAYI
jgi:hypothetical protein